MLLDSPSCSYWTFLFLFYFVGHSINFFLFVMSFVPMREHILVPSNKILIFQHLQRYDAQATWRFTEEVWGGGGDKVA